MEDVKTGVQHLLAEMINETAEVRRAVKAPGIVEDRLSSRDPQREDAGGGTAMNSKPYFQFKEAAQETSAAPDFGVEPGREAGAREDQGKLEVPADLVFSKRRGPRWGGAFVEDRGHAGTATVAAGQTARCRRHRAACTGHDERPEVPPGDAPPAAASEVFALSRDAADGAALLPKGR